MMAATSSAWSARRDRNRRNGHAFGPPSSSAWSAARYTSGSPSNRRSVVGEVAGRMRGLGERDDDGAGGREGGLAGEDHVGGGGRERHDAVDSGRFANDRDEIVAVHRGRPG